MRVSEGPSRGAADDAAAEPRRGRRRWPWVALAGALALAVLLRAALPALASRGAAWASRRYLGLPASIDEVDFELLRGRASLEGVALGARPDAAGPGRAALSPPRVDPAEALVSVARVAAQISWRDLVERRLRVELVFESPALRLVREGDGRVDPLRHARPALAPAPPADEPELEGSGPGWTIALDRLELVAPALRLGDAASGEEIARVSLERFAVSQLALAGGEAEIGGVDLDGLVVHARRDLLLAAPAPGAGAEAAQADAAPPEPAAAAPPDPAAPHTRPRHRVAKIELEGAAVRWITDQGPLDVTVSLRATDVTADEGRRFPVSVEIEVEGGRIGASGELGLLPPAYTGTLSWSGLPIPRLLLASVPHLATWLQRAQSSGELALDADFAGAKGEPATRASGRLSFDELAVADPKGSELTLGWKALEVVVRDAHAPIPRAGTPLGTTRAVLERVTLSEPEIRYTRPSPQLDALLGIDLSGAGAAAAARDGGGAGEAPAAALVPLPPPAPEAAARAGALELEIASLETRGGEIDALDRTVEPAARTRVRGLSFRATGVRYPEVAASGVRLQATLPGRARLDVTGDLRAGNAGDFRLAIARLALPVFNPYASAAAGVTVERGSASVDAQLAVRGAAMELDSRVVLHDLAVSLRDPATFEREFGVPVDLALALLRDRSGDIALRVPVRVDETGAGLDLGAIAASAAKAALIGALSSPIKLAGAALGAGDGGLSVDPLAYEAGSTALAGDATPRLDALAALARDHPLLGLSLHGRAGPPDRPLLAEQVLVEGWQRGEGLPELEGAGLLARRRIGAALERRAAGAAAQLDPDDQALYERYVAATAVPRERLDDLAAARAARVRDELVARGVAAERIELGEPAAEGPPGVVLSLEPAG